MHAGERVCDAYCGIQFPDSTRITRLRVSLGSELGNVVLYGK